MEPAVKKKKYDFELKDVLQSMQVSFLGKLKCIEDKIETLSAKYQILEEKVDNALAKISTESNDSNSQVNPQNIVTLNSEVDYPDGSWLGDPDNPGERVRCQISPQNLEEINKYSQTSTKMALKLLDHLFDRETQARSNVSGTGKHAKEQLDPLKIHGIYSHLVYMFKINNEEWSRIHHAIDSKCRTAFHRKKKGLPLVIRGSTESSDISPVNVAEKTTIKQEKVDQCQVPPISQKVDQCQVPPISQEVGFKIITPLPNMVKGEIKEVVSFELQPDGSLTVGKPVKTQIIHTDQGSIQVIHPTPDQYQQLKLKSNPKIELISRVDLCKLNTDKKKLSAKGHV